VTARGAARRAAAPGERPPLRGDLVVLDGAVVHVLSKGEGRPVVLLHGNGTLGEEILSAFPRVPGVRWIAPDRPGFGYSDALADGQEDPVSQALWLERLLPALGLSAPTIVAHSLAAGSAIALAAARPARVGRLVLLAPFCRPTPERIMPGLRLASAPGIGGAVRRLLIPLAVRYLRRRIIEGFMAPNRPPPWLQAFPVTHAANPRSIRTMAAELKTFNAGMEQIEGDIRLTQPVTVVHGLADRTAEPERHLPWLRARARDMTCLLLRGCGHAVHHAAPNLVLRAVLEGRVDDPRDFAVPHRPSPRQESSAHAPQAAAHDQHTGYVVA
jgi:pimeloyl-ACP methyl ester carboxylesterase